MTAGESVQNDDGVRAGTVVAGRYRLERIMAEGGMGTVWVATNLVLESSVALKVLHRSTLDNPEAGARLLTEARAAASVRHPNILQVFDFGHFDTGQPFLVMELLDGEDLADRIRALGRLEPAYAVDIIRKVAGALEAAHLRGIIHRDLKPENIFLSVDESCRETPKVVDFGIAWVASRQSGPRLTQAGRVVGSPAYLSPEQARGELVDCRTDVWSLCVTLYEALTGKAPFADPSQPALLIKILYDNPEPITAMGIGDGRLWKIIDKGLRKDRNDRWQSIGELATALESWAVLRPGSNASERETQPAPARPSGNPGKDDSIPPAPGITVAPPAPTPKWRGRLRGATLVVTAALPLLLLALVETAGSRMVSAASRVDTAAATVAIHARRIGYSSSRAALSSPAPEPESAPEASAGLPTARPTVRKPRPNAVRKMSRSSIPPEPNF